MMTARIVEKRHYRTLQEALDRIEELEIELGMPVQKAQPFGLTRREFEIASIIGKTGYASKDRVYVLVYGNDTDLEVRNLTAVFVVRIRRKLAPHGIKISNVRGVGYAMDPDSLAIWRKAIAGEAA